MKSLLLLTFLMLFACCCCVNTDEGANSGVFKGNYPRVLQQWLRDSEAAPLIDYSFVGYQRGEKRPSVKSLNSKVFDVGDYGAFPDDGLDDIDAIQQAIDAAAEAGGGIVKIPPGQFDFDVQTNKRFLHLHSSNIVLLGGGEGPDGTTIFDHSPSTTPDPKKPWLAGQFPSFVHVGADLSESPPYMDSNNMASRVLVGKRNSLELKVDRPEKLTEGTVYLLTQQETPDSSLLKALIAPLSKAGVNYCHTTGPDSYKMQHMVRVKKIEDNRVTLCAPLLMDLEPRWQPKLWAIPNLIENVAVIGFSLKNNWQDEFHHHLNGIHDNGYNGVNFRYVADGWIQALIAYNTSSAASLHYALNCSVFDVQIRGNPGHNGFNLNGASTRNLFYNCRAGNSMHSFAVSGWASGNVYYNCSADQPSAIDLHGGLGMNNLFDNIFGPVFKHGGSSRNLPPALGRGQVFWNWKVGLFEPYKGKFKPSVWNSKQLPAFIAVGVTGMEGQQLRYEFSGKMYTGDLDSLGTSIEAFNQGFKSPPSLFLFQREMRLGRDHVYEF